MGTVLLMLPFSTLDKVPTSFHEALFTATSAVCVTRPCCEGYWKLLVCGRTDDYSCTHTNWRAWCGNGGSICFPFFWKKISLMQRSTMQDAISAPKVGGIVRLTRFILKGTFLIEAAGTLLLLPAFFFLIMAERESGCQCFIQSLLFVMPGLIFWGRLTIPFLR